MPVVQTKKAMADLAPGQILEVLATDRGSVNDLKAWAQTAGHEYLGLEERDGVLHHRIRKGQ